MKKRQTKIRLAVWGLALLFLLACSCPLTQVAVADMSREECEEKGGLWIQETAEDGKIKEWCGMPAENPRDACSLAASVTVTRTLLKNEVNESNTRLCTYQVDFEIPPSPAGVWFMGDVHKADVWEKSESREWRMLSRVEPNASKLYSFSGYFDVYNERDAVGPTLLVIERYNAILNTPECAELRLDPDFLQRTSLRVPTTCP